MTGAEGGFEIKEATCRREEMRNKMLEAPGEKDRGGGEPPSDWGELPEESSCG